MDFLTPQTLVRFLLVIAAFASVISLTFPYMTDNTLQSRMKSVALERERLRLAERQRAGVPPKATRFMHLVQQIVRSLDLRKWLGEEQTKAQLSLAGFRGTQAEIVFLFFRAVMPIGLAIVTTTYVFFVLDLKYTLMVKIMIVLVSAYIGFKLPGVFLTNTITKRQLSLKRAAPDMIDLLLICLESGVSLELAFQRVGVEVGAQSVPMAEEIALTLAEMSYLPDRRTAFQNLVKRTEIDSIKQVVTVLIQSEKYGTSLAHALRTVADESRSSRMMEAEKKAAALPPKLTVPMIVFFLPVLFAIIITPAAIQIAGATK